MKLYTYTAEARVACFSATENFYLKKMKLNLVFNSRNIIKAVFSKFI